MFDELANELILASVLLKTNNINVIAEQIGYKPLLITTALYRGNDTGKFVWNKKKNIIQISEDVEIDSLVATDGMNELVNVIEEFMLYVNREEKDQSIEEMQMWLGGTPELHVRMAAKLSKKLSTYEGADPKDKQNVYTFITLNENLDKKWGLKQFDPKNSKAAKLAKKNKTN